MANLRNLLLYGALAATLAASVLDWDATWLHGDADTVTELRPQSSSGLQLPRSRPHQVLDGGDAINRPSLESTRRLSPMAANLFAVHSWLPPEPKQVVQEPRAPALPFKYMGQMVQDGETVVILDQASLTHLARKGQVIGSYRVDNIGARDISFVYLPLSETQRLTFGTTP